MTIQTRWISFCWALLMLLPGCGGGGKSTPVTPPTPAAPTITSFSATPTSVVAGASSTLSWNVVGATSLSIDQGAPAASGATGTVTVSPTTTTLYTLTATNGGGSTTATATVTVTATPPAVAVAINPTTASVQTGQTQLFTATVTGAGTGSTAVTWTVVGTNHGTVSPAGLYTAPGTAGSYQVVATSVADPTKSATATVTVTTTPPVVAVAISPTTASVQTGQTQPFTATVTGAGTGSTAVTWSVVGTNHGTVSPAGLYTAPVTAGTYQVVATSVADPTKSATATVTVTTTPPVVAVAINPTTASVKTGQTQQFTATVTGAGSGSTAVTWTVVGTNAGSVSGTGLYTAPATAGSYQVRATSVADPTKSATATVTVTAAVPAPVISAFVAAPTSIASGATSTLSWTVTGAGSTANSVTLSGVGDVTGKSSQVVTPAATTTYTLTATGAGGSTSASVTVTVTGGTTANQWVMGYYVGYHNGLQTPAQVDYSAMTHVIVGPVLPNDDGTTWATHFDIDATAGPIWARDVVARAHNAGIKALVMLGGMGSEANFALASAPAVRATSITNLVAIVNAYGFDGVDLDWENYNVATTGADVETYLRDLRTAMPNKIITMPVGWNNANFNEKQNSHFGRISQSLDRVSTMSYGMFSAGGGSGWLSWHMAALSGSKSNTPSSLENTVNALVTAGVPKAKIGIGFGFYGHAYQVASGASDAGLVSGPNQNADATQDFTVFNTADNVLSYSNLMQFFITPDVVRWDEVPQSTYLSFAAAKAVDIGTYPTYHIRTRYITYEDERSIAAKGNWARAQGLGGAIIWTISEGYLPWRTSGEKDPLMKAVKAALISPQGAPQILTFTASAATVASGQPVTLGWTTANTTSVAIDHGVTAITGMSGTVTVNPTATTSYTLSVTNASGATITAVCTVTVN